VPKVGVPTGPTVQQEEEKTQAEGVEESIWTYETRKGRFENIALTGCFTVHTTLQLSSAARPSSKVHLTRNLTECKNVHRNESIEQSALAGSCNNAGIL
jgi:hypothetical protein